jgi:hypothetical protein
MLNGRRQPSLGRTSRVNREVYARFCERLAVRFRGPTRPLAKGDSSGQALFIEGLFGLAT